MEDVVAGSDHTAAVERAIAAMKAGLSSPQPLTELARRGMFSPYHFHRIFREVTAVTPARFLAALRMAEARRLLLHSTLPVTTVSSRVGYTSSGTFTTQFGLLTGLSPGRFRALLRALGDEPVGALLPLLGAGSASHRGAIVALSGAPVPASLTVGRLFPSALTHERAALWTLEIASGRVRLPEAPAPGDYAAFSVVVPPEVRLADALVDGRPGSCLVARARVVQTADGRSHSPAQIPLRRPIPVDPPLLAMTPICWLAEVCR